MSAMVVRSLQPWPKGGRQRTLLSLLRIPEHLDARVLVERHALMSTRNDAADAVALLLALDVILGRKVEGDCAATSSFVSNLRRG